MKVRLRPGSVARAEDLLTACVRECAAHLVSLEGPAPAQRTGLVAAIGVLVAEHTAFEPSADRSFDALLDVGRRALDAGEVRLARRLADSAVALRPGAGGAWGLRAEALEADGREEDAMHAQGRFETLTGHRLDHELPLDGGDPIGVDAFRAQLAGRSVCVVANGESMAASGLGAEIDAYDLVVRVDSFQTHREGTGERVDVHAVSHRSGGPGWRRRAHTRLVFAEQPAQWRAAIRGRLVAGAQSYVGDLSLSRPVRDPALIGEVRWAAEPTTAFTVARLLDHLDVNPRIDLFGFAVPGQLRAEERQWILGRARARDGLRLSLR
ncbi:glycosyltransferase family 29 protein [Streptomyces sp. PT12]|uniref:glycosyltransferase family 29 protein n=1 Tax=Streptomyces sp. PT12 TaxID=1510197 RepID=UPI0015EEDF97|nr:glycosyltransferase family 29 protein [Streptomyces sp. PT12]